MYKNRVVLEGFLGADSELRYLPSGDKVANASLATETFWTDAQDRQKQATEWHALVFYGARADPAERYRKGDNLHVEGQIQSRRYVNAQNQPKVVREIVVLSSHRIDRMGSAPAHDAGSETPGADETSFDDIPVADPVGDNMPEL